MRPTIEEQLKTALEQANQNAPMGLGGYSVSRSTLRDRVNGQLQGAEHEAYKAQRLRELLELLDKNPEVGRILELIEDVLG